MTKFYSPNEFTQIITFVYANQQCFDNYWLVDVSENKKWYDILLKTNNKILKIDWINVCLLSQKAML